MQNFFSHFLNGTTCPFFVKFPVMKFYQQVASYIMEASLHLGAQPLLITLSFQVRISLQVLAHFSAPLVSSFSLFPRSSEELHNSSCLCPRVHSTPGNLVFTPPLLPSSSFCLLCPLRLLQLLDASQVLKASHTQPGQLTPSTSQKSVPRQWASQPPS